MNLFKHRIKSAPFGTALLQEEANERLRVRKVRDAVDALLRADVFDDTSAVALADRGCYADAATYLLRIVSCPGRDFIPAVLRDDQFAAYRVALAFGAVSGEAEIMAILTVADFRSIGTPAARLALVASGADYDWSSLDRRGRAVFTLRHLVRTRHSSIVSYDTAFELR
jgi:hypothetical protein